MALPTSNVFYRLGTSNDLKVVRQLAHVVCAADAMDDALEMLRGQGNGFDTQRKRLIVALEWAPYSKLRDQAEKYLLHVLYAD